MRNEHFDNLLNSSSRVDLLMVEHELRREANREFARALARTIKVSLRNIGNVLAEAAELQRKHSKTTSGAV